MAHNLAIDHVCTLYPLTRSCILQVGAVIVRDDRIVVATGYNGMVQYPQPDKDNDVNNDSDFPWIKNEKDPLNNKRFYGTVYKLHALHRYYLYERFASAVK